MLKRKVIQRMPQTLILKLMRLTHPHFKLKLEIGTLFSFIGQRETFYRHRTPESERNCRQGIIQTKFEVGHRVWDLRVWETKILNSKKIYMIKINKRAKNQIKNKRRRKITKLLHSLCFIFFACTITDCMFFSCHVCVSD